MPYLEPTDPQDIGSVSEPTAWSPIPTQSVAAGADTGRALPDLSADAELETGYLQRELPALEAGSLPLASAGGTSFTSPHFRVATAEIA